MTPEEFEQLIAQREGETLDFKQEMPSSSDLVRLVTAFYNTRGGTIVFGVEDGTRRLMGVPNPQGIEEGVINILRARCSLDVMPTVEFVAYQDTEFVVVRCVQGARKPYLVSGETRPYIRVGSSNREAQDEEVRRLYIEGSEGGFEALSCRGATLADLSERLIADYIRRREETSGQSLGLSSEETLRSLGCLANEDGRLAPTNAGVMLFADDPQRSIGQAEVACVRFKGTDVVSYIDRRDLHGPLYQLVDDAEQFIYRHMKVGRRIEGFVGVELGSRYIERLGTGIRRMALAMEGHGLPRPRFEEVGSEFRVTLMGPGERFMAEPEELPAWAKGLNERQVEAVLYAGEHERITAGQYQALVGVSDVTAYRDLKDLCDKGLLIRHGKGRGTYYILAG
ncbi:MAG: hypothetical protein FJ014_05450 [Chloroflexi bacterium]|nr:hypothetical protein [Chloroflexota bacterium]